MHRLLDEFRRPVAQPFWHILATDLAVIALAIRIIALDLNRATIARTTVAIAAIVAAHW